MKKILVIDDDQSIRKTLSGYLKKQNYEVLSAENGLKGIEILKNELPDLVITDIRMPGADGFEVLKNIKEIDPHIHVIIITAFDDMQTTVKAMQLGAYDYIEKPLEIDNLKITIQRALENKRLSDELTTYVNEKTAEYLLENTLIGKTPQMRQVFKKIGQVSSSRVTVLIEGESGTGKEILARFIHQYSKRNSNAFVTVNCAAIPESLFESEVFGHVKGSFTGALKDRIGRFETADQGSVFLDEVGEIPKPMQVKLLRFLQNMEFERVGESISRKINVRIISATNRNIDEDIKNGDFREDFYYRMSGIRIKLPPLRERKEDIPLLTEYFLKKYSPEVEIIVSPEVTKLLSDYNWPGNIRELENVINRAIILAKNQIIKKDHLPSEIYHEINDEFDSEMLSLNEIEKKYIIKVLNLFNNPKDAARILGISLTTLWRKRKEYKI